MLTLAILIFLLAYVFIACGKVDESIPAMLGASAMVAFGIISFSDAMRSIELNVLGLLIGMMVVVNIAATTGVFEYIAVKIARQTKGNGVLIMMELMLATSIISAFMDNVTTVILLAPVTILITQLLALPTIPFLIAEAIFSNIGGTATLIGDPPNILIGTSMKLGFNDFIVNLTPVIAVVTAVSLAALLLHQRKYLKTTQDARRQMMLTDPAQAILKPRELRFVLLISGLMLLGFFTSFWTKLEPGFIAITGAFLMALLCRTDFPSILRKAEWNTILFFCGLFIMVSGLEHQGLFEKLGLGMVELTRGNFALTMMIILWGGGLLSAFINNVPLIIAMIPLISSIIPVFSQQMGLTGTEEIAHTITQPLCWALALGTCLGGNGTLIGASANVVVAQIARRNNYQLNFRTFTWYGFPLMILSLIVSTVYLYWRYL